MSIFHFIGSRFVSQSDKKFCRHQGMMLLEIIISFGIIAIIALAIAQYQALSSFWYRDSTYRMIALNKAINHLESIMASGFHEAYFPKQEGIFRIFAKTDPYSFPLPSLLLNNSYLLRLVSVRVEWVAPSKQIRSVVLRTIIE